jgi:hypothetical protein
MEYWFAVISVISFIGFLVFKTINAKEKAGMMKILSDTSILSVQELNQKVFKRSVKNALIVPVATLFMTASLVTLIGFSFNIKDPETFFLLQAAGFLMVSYISIGHRYYAEKETVFQNSLRFRIENEERKKRVKGNK